MLLCKIKTVWRKNNCMQPKKNEQKTNKKYPAKSKNCMRIQFKFISTKSMFWLRQLVSGICTMIGIYRIKQLLAVTNQEKFIIVNASSVLWGLFVESNSAKKTWFALPLHRQIWENTSNKIWQEQNIKNKKRSRTAMFSVNGAEKNWSTIQQITFTKKPKIDKKISMETLSKEYEPAALEKLGHEIIWQKKKINRIFWRSRPIKIPTREKIRKLSKITVI